MCVVHATRCPRHGQIEQLLVFTRAMKVSSPGCGSPHFSKQFDRMSVVSHLGVLHTAPCTVRRASLIKTSGYFVGYFEGGVVGNSSNRGDEHENPFEAQKLGTR